MCLALLVFPGRLSTPTGGYAYDREVLARLPAHGVEAAPLSLDGAFPHPAPTDVAAALDRLKSSDSKALLLVDGLALGALPADGLAQFADRLVALVHHPLALEEGLDPGQSRRLLASETAALALARAVITTSPATRRTLEADFAVPADRLVVAEPGTDRVDRAPADGAPPRLLCVGSVIPRKGYDVLVAALAGLKDLPWSLTLIGSLDLDPAASAALRQAIAVAGLGDRIVLSGAVDRERLAAAYRDSDLFVHPSLYEGYGMVLAEALRHGLPLVCTTGGAACETVPDGAGLKVAPGDPSALAAALRRLLSAPRERRVLADAAFAAGRRLPGWDDTAARIAAVLRRVAQARKETQ
ncbi:glycosyltransferase family 4 protein [Aquabacter spiritensis]|nr:glycosyltransferase family 4 protein [Aquabacter spiritensis]